MTNEKKYNKCNHPAGICVLNNKENSIFDPIKEIFDKAHEAVQETVDETQKVIEKIPGVKDE